MLGVHVSKTSHVLDTPHKIRKTMYDAITQDCSHLNINVCQIFVQGPRNSKMSNMDYIAIREICHSNHISLYVHSSYITVGIFSITHKNKSSAKYKKYIDIIVDQFKACDALYAKGLVIHLTKRTPESILESLEVLYPFISMFKTPLILEQPAKKPDPTKTYETPEQINILTKLIHQGLPDLNWGWCIDTAHLYSAGIRVDDQPTMKTWLRNIEYNNIKLFHLNGMSNKLFNTGKDTHEVVFGPDDDIWKTTTKIKKSSIFDILKYAKKNKIDIICEINRGTYEDIKYSIETLLDILS